MIEFKKVTLPFATDIIAEKFDNILELIHPNAFVYGGVLRDIAAGLPLEGDLDIVASGKDYDFCISRIGNSSKWRRCDTQIGGLIRKIKQPDYKTNEAIKNVIAFETLGERKVELVRAKIPFTKSYITAALKVVKTVDIRCCGIAMDIYGTAFEIVEGAYQDCLDRILRLNKLNSGVNIENLKNRIAKLEKRGWTSRINIDKTSKMLKKIELAAKKEYMKKGNSRAKHSGMLVTRKDNIMSIMVSDISSKIQTKYI